MKTMTSAKQWAVGLVAVAALAAPGRSEAGESYNYPPNCSKNADGSGSCQGSMKGFRNSTYADAYATFEINLVNNWTYFYARYNNQSFSCYPDATTADRYAAALASNGYFYVVWNSSGTCTTLYVFNESPSY